MTTVEPVSLYDYQRDSIKKLKNGSILCGGVGSGKSRTSLAYYCIEEGYSLDTPGLRSVPGKARDLYIITTARKRDTFEWEDELVPFALQSGKNPDGVFIKIDSWNNIGKYSDVENSFFIFDEQRVVGKGAWVKAFLEIAKHNKWILLSATPGDTWQDYIPVFLANGFYKNRTAFNNEHCIYARFSKFPRVERYVGTKKLEYYRSLILVPMNYTRDTTSHDIDIFTNYDVMGYKKLMKERWNTTTGEPIVNAAELCYELRKIVNSSEWRTFELKRIVSKHPRVIIFYSYDYELELLRSIDYGENYVIAEWNGHKHEPVPKTNYWVYLVNYSAGAEGWNCIETDTIIFYSQNYSYKTMVQAAGRIDRNNTPFKDLYYYHLKSHAGIDLAIAKALKDKKDFNEKDFGDFNANRRNRK